MTVKSEVKEYYEILELPPGATPERAKKAYYQLVKQWHPDRFNDDPELKHQAEEKLIEINHAYDSLQEYFRVQETIDPSEQNEEPVQYGVSDELPTFEPAEITLRIAYFIEGLQLVRGRLEVTRTSLRFEPDAVNIWHEGLTLKRNEIVQIARNSVAGLPTGILIKIESGEQYQFSSWNAGAVLHALQPRAGQSFK